MAFRVFGQVQQQRSRQRQHFCIGAIRFCRDNIGLKPEPQIPQRRLMGQVREQAGADLLR